MSKIGIDKQALSNKKNSLTSAKAHLNYALNEVSNISIPGNLYGEEVYFLQHLGEKISSIISSLNYYGDWIDNSICCVNNTISELHKEVDKISEAKLVEQSNSVLLK